MEKKIKETGATFTPQELSDFLANQITSSLGVKPSLLKVLDPACGNGNLLLSVGKSLQKMNLLHTLVGYDTDEEYLTEAKSRLLLINETSAILKNEDFLLGDDLLNANDVSSIAKKRELVDVIIANPPYVRTQVLGAERSQMIAQKYSLKGKIDLYYPFLISMTNSLKPGGILGVITSNRYLTTKSGGQIRKYFLDHFEIIKVIDLGDTKLFDAAVLPAIFIGKKKTSKKSAVNNGAFSKIYEIVDANATTHPAKSIIDILDQSTPGIYTVGEKNYLYNQGLLKHSLDHSDIWQMTDKKENEWIDKIKNNAAFFVGDKFKVRVGIKSCADKVFIKEDWTKEDIIPEKIFFRHLLSQENLNRWKAVFNNNLSVLYPHYDNRGKRGVYDIEQYPKAKAFFEKNKEALILENTWLTVEGNGTNYGFLRILFYGSFLN